MSELAAAAWLLGLLIAAPALRLHARYGFVDRLRDALVLGCAIPLLLATLHLLAPWACWGTLAIALGIAARRGYRPESDDAPIPYATAAVVAIAAWPNLIRPLLDGDSLAYHLPLAASWVQHGSLWTTATRYWWYPAGSESFAAGLYAIAGPFALGWSGVGALALLGWRLAATARARFALPAYLADALAAATIAALPLALQAATLQNDVWLAAFFLEALVADRASGIATGALCALIKPYGWIFALLAAFVRRSWRYAAVALAVLALWVLRDGLLFGTALVAPRSTGFGDGSLGTSILAHAPAALVLLAQTFARYAPFAALAWLAALGGPLLVRDRRLGLAAMLAALFFLAMPFGYDSVGAPQLATGASLRFAAPAIALGALVLAPLLLRYPRWSAALLWLFALQGASGVLAVFWNDAPTRSALLVAALALAIAVTARRIRAWLAPLAFALAIAVAVRLAGAHPLDYYRDAARARGESTGIDTWLAHAPIAALDGWGLRIGVVNVLAPQIRTYDTNGRAPCAFARRTHAVLVALAQPGPPARNRARLARARRCGRVLYDDRLAVAAFFAY